MRTRASCLRGFTLVELLVTIAIGSLLMLVAVPSFVEFRRNALLSDAVSNLMAAHGTARSAALKTGRNTFIRPIDTTVGWTSGWLVFTDSDWNNAFDAGTDPVLLRHDALGSEISVASSTAPFSAGYMRFDGSGFPRTISGAISNATLSLTNGTRTSNIIVDVAGRVRSCSPPNC